MIPVASAFNQLFLRPGFLKNLNADFLGNDPTHEGLV
jgi:hypothetical protein